MFAQRNYGLHLAILAVIGLTASASSAGSKAPTTQPASSLASATNFPAPQPGSGELGRTAAPSAATQTPTTAPAEVAAKEIPLEKVWAYQMPGTHPMDVTLLEDGKTYATADGKMIGEVLAGLKDFGSDVRGGFAVAGTNSAALIEAHKVLAGGAAVGGSLDRSQKISVVFFSNQPGLYVHLKKITQKGSLVEIAYQFVARESKDPTPQLAIIPLYDLPAGTLKIVLRSEGNPSTPVDPHDVAEGGGPSIILLSATPE
jgi:hypothetical protein